MTQKLITDLAEVATALLGIGPGLTIDLIHAVLRAGEAARTDVDSYLEPVNAAGWEQFRGRVKSVRQELLGFGWTPEAYRGASLVVSPDKQRQLWLMIGTDTTGQDGNATTLRPRGPAFKRCVDRNQMLLFPELEPAEVEDEAAVLRETWVLLVHRRVVEREGELFVIMQTEVSLAKSLSNRRPNDWHARYGIPELELPAAGRMDFTQGDDFEVPVIPIVPGADEALETQSSDGDVETGEEQEGAAVDVAVDQIEADRDNAESNEE